MLQYGALPTNYPDPDPETGVDKTGIVKTRNDETLTVTLVLSFPVL